MMLIAASWPSNRLAAVTNRTGLTGTCRCVHRVAPDLGEGVREIVGHPTI